MLWLAYLFVDLQDCSDRKVPDKKGAKSAFA